MQWHETLIRVRFNEVDSWGIVWYGNYFSYLDVARCEVLEKFDLLPDTLVKMGYTAPVYNIASTFKSPARFNDMLLIRISLQPQKSAKLVFVFQILHASTKKLIMHGETTQVLLNSEGYMVYKLTGALAQKIEALTSYLCQPSDKDTNT
jgi:acyl-CoA thioester hydrolase